MSRTSGSIVRLLAGLLLAAPLFTAHAVDQTATPTVTRHHKSHKKTAQLVLPPMPTGPLRQLPMEQIPAALPRVTYENGLLSITAQNATLGEILRDVRKLTGASIDIPPGGGGERVVVQLGPGAPRDVLALLLNGSSFNYVMLGSASDPMGVASVMLTLKPSGAGAGAVSGEVQTAANTPANAYQPPPTMPPSRFPGPQGFRQPPAAGAPGATTTAADDSTDDSDADDKDDDSDAAQAGQGAAATPDIQTQIEQQGTDPNQPNAGPKTPEQLLEMMRRGQPVGAPNGPPVVNPNPPQQ